MSRTNKTRHIKWYETCKCKCRLDASVCNNKQRWNDDKCRCECKELIKLIICIGIGAYFTYKYINRNKENVFIYDFVYQAKNY